MTELEQGLVRDSDREDSALAAAEPAQGPGVCSTHPGGAPIAATAHDSFGAPREKNSAVTGSSPLAPETRLPPHHLSKCSACGRDVGPASSRHQQQRPQRQTQSRSQGTARFLGATVSFALPAAPPQWWPWRGGRCREEHHLLSKLLEAKATHIVIIGLVLLDLAIVCTELILSSTYCDREATPHAVHVAEDWLRWASVAILCIFVAELLLRLLVYGLSYYSTSFFHLLDLGKASAPQHLISPSVLLGVGLIGAGVSLYQVRQVRPEISKDYDVVISCISLLVGGILIFQGWRLDPLLLFGQLMTTGAAVSFAVEALRLRSEHYQDEEKAQLRDIVDRNRPGGSGGAALQLPEPENKSQQAQQPWAAAAGSSSSRVGWDSTLQQQQQQQQPQQQGWDGSYYNGYYQQAQQPEAAPSGTAGTYPSYEGGQYYTGAGAAGNGDASNSSNGSSPVYEQGYPYQQQQPGQPADMGPSSSSGGQYVEPDYTLPPADQAASYGGYGYGRPAEYVFPTADQAGGSPGWPTGPGVGQQQPQQQQQQQSPGGIGAATARRPGVGGAFDAEDWD